MARTKVAMLGPDTKTVVLENIQESMRQSADEVNIKEEERSAIIGPVMRANT